MDGVPGGFAVGQSVIVRPRRDSSTYIQSVNDDDYKRAREEYWRARENGRLAIVLVPIVIAATILWVVVHPDYQPGDWRADPVARTLVGLAAISVFVVFGVLSVRRWRDAERRLRGGP